MPELAAMRSRWESLAASFPGARPLPEFEEIVALHAAPPRHYHTLDHVARCLAELDRVRHRVPDTLVVELALWFHDIVYDTRRPDNEARSAEVAADFLARLGADAPLIERVKRAILATKHAAPADDPAARWTADIDLVEGLAAETPEAFERGCAAIREEYAWVPAPLYAATRAALLRKFLEQGSIFFDDGYQRSCEPRARENIAAEIRRLESRP